MLRKLFAFALPLAALAVVPAIAVAQNAVLSQFYGNGVHAFFSGNMSRANEELTTAINSGSKDPRAYYFRGLTQMKMGYRDAAIADFQKGAKLETADASRNYPVSKSLERVQGSDRLALERYRAVARASSVARQEQRMQARYEALRRNEADKLRRVATPRVEIPALAVERQPAAAQGTPATATAPAGGDDLFAAPAAPTDTPGDVLGGGDAAANDPENPFGESAVEGATEPAGTPEVAPAEGAAEDLFGDATESTETAPVVTERAATEPAGTEPAATEPAAGDAADPFADDPAMTEDAATEGATTEGAGTEEAPVDGAAPAATEEAPAMEEAAGDDPFGQ
jgi:hypothetical protein